MNVFSTIIENIRSFFHREDELAATPKRIPEAASEVFERPESRQPLTPGRIIDRPLPDQAPPQATAPLPFSPEQLRSALQRAGPPPMPTPAPPPPRAQTPAAPATNPQDFHIEIAEFESTLREAHERAIKDTARPAKPARTTSPPTTSQGAGMEKSFFSEFEQFMLREDMQAEGVLDQDIVHRLREFHDRRKDGKEYYTFSKDLEAATQRKLADLKQLEEEWFSTRSGMDEMEKSLALIEREIEARSAELKSLVVQARSKSRLERKAPPGQEFVLSDGRKLSSLLDLRLALRTMPDTVFSQHVNPHKNDFAAWARGTFGDAEVAANLGQSHNKEQMMLLLGKLG